jgi:hypothetical protein
VRESADLVMRSLHCTALCAALLACEATPAVAPADAAPDLAADRLDVVPPDAAPDAAPDVALDSSGRTCSFNRDCPDVERCACEESAGCRCLVGPRGTGRAGVDVCTSGDDCASALCVEANGAVSLCSDACTAASECPGALPRCLSVPLVGRFCARDPAATGDAGAPDAPAGCPGECARTTLQGTFGAMRGAFDRAQHGNAGSAGLRVEAHFGGDPACPNETSPTPRRTVVITGLRATADATPQTEADGVRATLFDFGGELVSEPLVRATAVRVTPRAWMRSGYVSLDVSLSFPGGTITGGLFAPHCPSLDGT